MQKVIHPRIAVSSGYLFHAKPMIPLLGYLSVVGNYPSNGMCCRYGCLRCIKDASRNSFAFYIVACLSISTLLHYYRIFNLFLNFISYLISIPSQCKLFERAALTSNTVLYLFYSIFYYILFTTFYTLVLPSIRILTITQRHFREMRKVHFVIILFLSRSNKKSYIIC